MTQISDLLTTLLEAKWRNNYKAELKFIMVNYRDTNAELVSID